MASYKQTVRNTLYTAWLGKGLDSREQALIKSYNNYTSFANTRSALTANVTESIKTELDNVPHKVIPKSTTYTYMITQGGRKSENNKKPRQKKAWKRSDTSDKLVLRNNKNKKTRLFKKSLWNSKICAAT